MSTIISTLHIDGLDGSDSGKTTVRALHREDVDLFDPLARRPRLAIAGGRSATTYGLGVAADLAATVAGDRQTIITAATADMDARTVQAAAAASGISVMVTGAGLAHEYPARLADVRRGLVQCGGAVISVTGDDQVPTRERFDLARRVIAHLCSACLVVEAAPRSGAIRLAEYAHILGKPVGAIPGPITSTTSAGCHQLIGSGQAKIVTDGYTAAGLALEAVHT